MVAVVVLLQVLGAVAVMVNVMVTDTPVVLVTTPEILPVPLNGNAVVIPGGLSLDHVSVVDATLLGLLTAILKLLL